MYELVNTSLPNGLIAGTHGFATVAMTKGVSDILRGRLESLCAYTHRTSVHDAIYYQQNPVNWFHVILPQGEHVVGRVAPSDFDYTGRTNRLAWLRVFDATEMPSVGGAEILAKEQEWFAQSWRGEPRYLDEDRNTCGRLRMLNPTHASSAPAWESLFGSSGSRYAQQVAWQLEKNMETGGKTIYFKTSVAWDVSGEKLLGLFGDVINLLPTEMRMRVTFSTYPASLPGGTGCNLRGIYDRDRFFDASSATQAWVDCEHAKLVHAELLPTLGPKRADATPQNAIFKTEYAAELLASGSDISLANSKIDNRSTRRSRELAAVQDLINARRQGVDIFYVWLAIGVIIFLVAAAVVLCKFTGLANLRKDAQIEMTNPESVKPPARELPTSNGYEPEKANPVQYEKTFSELVKLIDSEKPKVRDIENLIERLGRDSIGVTKRPNHDDIVDRARSCSCYWKYWERIDEIKKTHPSCDPEYKKELSKIKKEVELKRSNFELWKLDVSKMLNRIEEMLQEKEVVEDDERKKQEKSQDEANESRVAVAYHSALKIYPRAKLDEDKKNFSTNNHCHVYYFNNSGVLVNENATYVWTEHRGVIGGGSWALKYGISYEKNAKDISKEAMKIVLWYNEGAKTLYVQQLTKSFSHTITDTNDVVRLDNGIFGSKEMREYYEKSINGKVAYEVRSEGKSSDPLATISESAISVAKINNEIREREARKTAGKIKKLQNQIANFDNAKKPLEKELSNLREAERKHIYNEKRIKEKEGRLQNKGGFGGKLNKKEKESLKKEIKALKDANQEILDVNGVREYNDIDKKMLNIRKCLNKKKMEEDLKRLQDEEVAIISGKKDIGTISPGAKLICTLVEGNDNMAESGEEQ